MRDNSEALKGLDPAVYGEALRWLEGDYDLATKEEVRRLLQEDPKELTDAFYTHLSFGTAGLRGLMGVGINRVNCYTIRAATQGLANYLKELYLNRKGLKVLIGYDCRNGSRQFAEETAKVLIANEIDVLIFSEIRPVPIVSFGCRYKMCQAAVMITASHNPAKYNGYKVYWSDGGQVLPPHDRGIILEVEKVREPKDVRCGSLHDSHISWIETEIDDAYLKATGSLARYKKENQEHGHELKIIYTSLHGAGVTMVPKSLRAWGFTSLIEIESQSKPDGDFPTVRSPNPEEHEALEIGLDRLQEEGGDLLLATDPDTDRVGAATLHNGAPYIFNGNEIAVLSLAHLLQAPPLKEMNSRQEVAVKTIVTTELFKVIADEYGCECRSVLTGFKYIGQLIEEWENRRDGLAFIFGAEESYGYLMGTHVRDKDGIIACNLLAEAALHAKLAGKNLVTRLEELYLQFGLFRDRLLSLTYPGKEGAEKIRTMMASLRAHPPETIGDHQIIAVEDYKSGLRLDLPGGKTTPLTLPTSDVLIFWLDEGSKVTIRPSGTEPKVKIYIGVKGEKSDASIQEQIKECDQKGERLAKAIQAFL